MDPPDGVVHRLRPQEHADLREHASARRGVRPVEGRHAEAIGRPSEGHWEGHREASESTHVLREKRPDDADVDEGVDERVVEDLAHLDLRVLPLLARELGRELGGCRGRHERDRAGAATVSRRGGRRRREGGERERRPQVRERGGVSNSAMGGQSPRGRSGPSAGERALALECWRASAGAAAAAAAAAAGVAAACAGAHAGAEAVPTLMPPTPAPTLWLALRCGWRCCCWRRCCCCYCCCGSGGGCGCGASGAGGADGAGGTAGGAGGAADDAGGGHVMLLRMAVAACLTGAGAWCIAACWRRTLALKWMALPPATLAWQKRNDRFP